jgi:hypothetical protein
MYRPPTLQDLRNYEELLRITNSGLANLAPEFLRSLPDGCVHPGVRDHPSLRFIRLYIAKNLKKNYGEEGLSLIVDILVTEHGMTEAAAWACPLDKVQETLKHQSQTDKGKKNGSVPEKLIVSALLAPIRKEFEANQGEGPFVALFGQGFPNQEESDKVHEEVHKLASRTLWPTTWHSYPKDDKFRGLQCIHSPVGEGCIFLVDHGGRLQKYQQLAGEAWSRIPRAHRPTKLASPLRREPWVCEEPWLCWTWVVLEQLHSAGMLLHKPLLDGACQISWPETDAFAASKTAIDLILASPRGEASTGVEHMSPLDQVEALFKAFAIIDPMQYVDAKYVTGSFKLNLKAAKADGQDKEYAAFRHARGIGFYQGMLKEQRAAFRTLARHGESVALLADEKGFDGQPILEYLERYTGDRRHRRAYDPQEEKALVEKIRLLLRRLRTRLSSAPENGGPRSGQADTKTDNLRKKNSIPKDAGRLLRLARNIKKALEKPGVRKTDVAREFNNFDERKAQKDLRALRRYPHLLD